MGKSFDLILQIDLWSSFPDLQANWRCRETGCLQQRKLRMPIIEGRHGALGRDVCLGIFQSGLDEICCKVGGSYKEFSRVYIARWHEFCILLAGMNSGNFPIPLGLGRNLEVTAASFLQIYRVQFTGCLADNLNRLISREKKDFGTFRSKSSGTNVAVKILTLSFACFRCWKNLLKNLRGTELIVWFCNHIINLAPLWYKIAIDNRKFLRMLSNVVLFSKVLQFPTWVKVKPK